MHSRCREPCIYGALRLCFHWARLKMQTLSVYHIQTLSIMLFLALVYYLSQTTVTAMPIMSLSPLSPSDSDACIDLSHCRTVWNIIWSCLAVIFSCTWVAVHPNIRSPKAREGNGWFQRLVWNPICTFASHRLPLFICALLVPEYILAWAMWQWFVARKIQKMQRGE